MPRHRETVDRLDPEQLALFEQAKEAHEKAQRAQRRARGALDARDDLIRQALVAGVAESLIAREFGMNRGMLWKIRHGVRTQEAERRRLSGGDAS